MKSIKWVIPLLMVLPLLVAARPTEAPPTISGFINIQGVIEQQSYPWILDTNGGTGDPIPGINSCPYEPVVVSPSGYLPVINPDCSRGWDTDDGFSLRVSGDLAAGQSLVISVPWTFDNRDKYFKITGGSRGNGSFTLTLGTSDNGWVSVPVDAGTCFKSPLYTLEDPRLSVIPGSNGGVGRQTDFLFTLTADRKIRSAWVEGSKVPPGNVSSCTSIVNIPG